MAETLNGSHTSSSPQLQIALALAIVKQKPSDVELREHILTMRQFIKDTKDSYRDTSPEKYFDSVSFWQKAYEKSEAEQSRLLDHTYELEQRNAALVAKLKTNSTGDSAAALQSEDSDGNDRVSSKRKVVGENMTSRKKTKATGSQIGSGSLVDGLEYMEGTTTSFMRQLYNLQKTLQKRFNRGSIVLAATGLCESATKEVLAAVTQSQKEPNTDPSKQGTMTLQMKQPDFPSLLHGVECAIGLLYQAINKLTDSKLGRDAGQVTYHLVCLFDGIMGSLQKHCIAEAEKATANVKTTKSKNKLTAKSKRGSTDRPAGPSASAQEEDAVAIQVCRMLVTMALSLKLSRAGHQHMLEGFLFILLSRVGKLLCLFVFQDLRLQPDLRIDTSKLPLPKGLVEADLNEVQIHGAQTEAKYLVWILERILAFIDASASIRKRAEKEEFVSRIKEKAQATLLQAVFGADDPLFQKPLQQPAPPSAAEMDSLRNSAQVPEQTVPDWFTQEVWRLLGWDLLMKAGHEDS